MKNIFSGNRKFTRCTPLIAGLMLFITACNDNPKLPGYEYMPYMYRSPSYETNSENPNFKDGMSNRKPVAGTIPVGYIHYPYPNTKEGYEAAGSEWKMPAEYNTPANLTEGKRLYESYCIHCHGPEGNSDGPVVALGFPPPPSYSKGKSSRGGDMKDLSDGKIYHTIEYGVNLMGSHASQLNEAERWKIIMYVHTLQKLGAPPVAITDTVTITSGDMAGKTMIVTENKGAKQPAGKKEKKKSAK